MTVAVGGGWVKRWALWVLLAMALAVAVWMGWRQGGTPAPSYRTALVERGDLEVSVSATGTLNPVKSVQVGTQVSGQIKELLVDFNSTVKRGQLIARIDPETFAYRVRQAQADTDAARAALARARVGRVNAQRELGRALALVEQNFLSSAELDTRQSALDLAAAEVDAAQAALKQREAQLAAAKVDLARTEIRAPVDGVVIKRSVDVGQTVAASLQAPELFVIAQDLRAMQVETSIDEADIGRIRVGQTARFNVDAFPRREFEASVLQVRKSATNVQNVITYTVLVSAANPDGSLMPGMTANVRIVTDTRTGVLKVPNAALRFKPEGQGARAPAHAPADGRPAMPLGQVWLPTDAGAQAVAVRVGVSDGRYTEVMSEELHAGMAVIVGSTGVDDAAEQGAARSPRGSPHRMMF